MRGGRGPSFRAQAAHAAPVAAAALARSTTLDTWSDDQLGVSESQESGDMEGETGHVCVCVCVRARERRAGCAVG